MATSAEPAELADRRRRLLQFASSEADAIALEARSLRAAAASHDASHLSALAAAARADPLCARLTRKLALIARLEAAHETVKALVDVHAAAENARSLAAAGKLSAAVAAYLRLPSTTNNAAAFKQKNDASDAKAVVEAAYMPVSDLLASSAQSIYAELKTHLSIGIASALDRISWPKQRPPESEIDIDDIWPELAPLLKLAMATRPPDEIVALNSLPAEHASPLVAELLAEPIARSFKFHFSGNKPTNRIDKPEYFCKYILSILTNQHEFLTSYIQPLLNESGFAAFSIEDMLVRQLADLVRQKLAQDLPQLLSQPPLLAHTVNEILRFDDSLRHAFLILPHSGKPWTGCVASILGNSNSRSVWVKTEKQAALLRFEEISRDSRRWESAFAPLESPTDATSHDMDPDDAWIPVIAERFENLVDALVEQLSRLSETIYRLDFTSDVLLPLFTTYLDFLSEQLWHQQAKFAPIGDRSASIEKKCERIHLLGRYASSAHALICSLDGWNDEHIFVELSQFVFGKSDQSDSILEETLLSEIMSRCRLILDETTRNIVDDIEKDVGESLWEYEKRSDWADISHGDAAATDLGTVSSELQDPLRLLASMLQSAKDAMPPAVFRSQILRQLGRRLEERFWNRIVVRHQFSEAGGRRFKIDIQHGLARVLREFHATPSALIPRMSAAATILALPTDNKGSKGDSGREKDAETSCGLLSLILAIVEYSDDAGQALSQSLEQLGVPDLDIHVLREIVGRRTEIDRI